MVELLIIIPVIYIILTSALFLNNVLVFFIMRTININKVVIEKYLKKIKFYLSKKFILSLLICYMCFNIYCIYGNGYFMEDINRYNLSSIIPIIFLLLIMILIIFWLSKKGGVKTWIKQKVKQK